MSHNAVQSAPVEFTARLLKSRRFTSLYGEVMGAVERCAAYLDGPGREERARLPADQQAAFVRLSMWMTTSLMRSASIVLVLRAVSSGDMNVTAALKELENARPSGVFGSPPAEFPGIPGELAELRDDSVRVKEAAERFVSALFGELPRPAESPARLRLMELQERLSGSLGQPFGA